MKRYFVLFTLTPLIALMIAELSAWVLWPGHPVVSLWYAPWTIAEHITWNWPIDNYVLTRVLDWMATKFDWPSSAAIYQWLQDSTNWSSWLAVKRGFLYAGVISGILWANTVGCIAWLAWLLRIRIGGMRVPPRAENLHTMIVGATQSGKTNLELQALADLRDRGDPVIVNDPSGEITKHFYGQGDRCDYILDAEDARSVSHSPFAELAAGIDAESLAEKIIGEGQGHEKEWYGFASGLLRDIFLSLVKHGLCTNADLTRVITADDSTLARLVKGQPTERYFAKGNEKFLGSVRSILSTYTAPLFGFDPKAGNKAFSIARHIQRVQKADGRGKKVWPWLFLKTRGGDLSKSQKQMLSCCMSVAVNSALSLPVNRERRIWFTMEELGNLGAISGLANMLTQGAKYGICAMAALQSVSQLEDLYGKERAQTILSCFNSVVVTRLADPQTAEYFERHFGKKEVVEWRRNKGSHGGHSSSGRSEQIRVRPKFYAHELMELDAKCITWIVGDHPRQRSVPRPKLAVVAEAFMPKPEASHQQPNSPAFLVAANSTQSQPIVIADRPQWEE